MTYTRGGVTLSSAFNLLARLAIDRYCLSSRTGIRRAARMETRCEAVICSRRCETRVHCRDALTKTVCGQRGSRR